MFYVLSNWISYTTYGTVFPVSSALIIIFFNLCNFYEKEKIAKEDSGNHWPNFRKDKAMLFHWEINLTKNRIFEVTGESSNMQSVSTWIL